jgi:hypothetical protein
MVRNTFSLEHENMMPMIDDADDVSSRYKRCGRQSLAGTTKPRPSFVFFECCVCVETLKTGRRLKADLRVVFFYYGGHEAKWRLALGHALQVNNKANAAAEDSEW